MSIRTSGCIKYPAQLRMFYALGNHDRTVNLGQNCSFLPSIALSRQSMLPGGHISSNLTSTCCFTLNSSVQQNVSERFAIALVSSSSCVDKNMNACKVLEFSTTTNLDQSSKNPNNKPNMDQIERVCAYLNEQMPRLFFNDVDFSFLDQQVQFEDNIRRIQTVGKAQFQQSVGLLKIFLHLKYVQIRLQVLSLTKDPENALIRVRFRIVGVKGFAKLVSTIRSKLNVGGQEPSVTGNGQKRVAESHEDWIDAIATFFVNEQGQISRIVCDNVESDENKTILEDLPIKVAAMLGFLHEFSH